MATNPPDVPSLLAQGMDALRHGDKAQARDLLTTVLEMDDRNELAWLWLSGAVESPAEQRICLENVLTINPGSTAARLGLAELDRIAPPPPPAPPAEAPPAPAALVEAGPLAAPVGAQPPPAEAVAALNPPVAAPVGPLGSPWGSQAIESPLPSWAGAPDGTGPALSAWPAAPATEGLPARAGTAPAAEPAPADWTAPIVMAPPAPGASLPEWPAPPAGTEAPTWDTALHGEDPWARLRVDLGAGGAGGPGTAADSAAPPAHDAWGALPSSPGAPASPSGADSGLGAPDIGGLQPFGFDPAAPLGGIAPAAENPWSKVEAAVPGLADVGSTPAPALFTGGEQGANLAAESPWAGTFGDSVLSGAPPPPPVEDPFLHIRQPALDEQSSVGSSPALIARPPIGSRVPIAVPTVPCPNCGELVTENALSCPRCQYRFYAPCPHCGDYIDTGAPDPKGHDKCPHCGEPVNKLALGREMARGGRRGAPEPVVVNEPGSKPAGKGKGDDRSATGTVGAWPAAGEAPVRRSGARALALILELIIVLALIAIVIYVLPVLVFHNWNTLYNPLPTPTSIPIP